MNNNESQTTIFEGSIPGWRVALIIFLCCSSLMGSGLFLGYQLGVRQACDVEAAAR